MYEEFAGRSLYFVRVLLMLPPQWASAREAADHLLLMRDAPPKFGSVMFYRSEPFGNCGIYVGSRMGLTVDPKGEPVLLEISDWKSWGGQYIGWCPADDLIPIEVRP